VVCRSRESSCGMSLVNASDHQLQSCSVTHAKRGAIAGVSYYPVFSEEKGDNK
jgi:hypothetical protein